MIITKSSFRYGIQILSFQVNSIIPGSSINRQEVPLLEDGRMEQVIKKPGRKRILCLA
jgi:hypothetical protein